MFGPLGKIVQTLKKRLAQDDRMHDRPDLCSLEDYEETFRDLFVTVDGGDPLYRHKRPNDKGESVRP